MFRSGAQVSAGDGIGFVVANSIIAALSLWRSSFPLHKVSQQITKTSSHFIISMEESTEF